MKIVRRFWSNLNFFPELNDPLEEHLDIGAIHIYHYRPLCSELGFLHNADRNTHLFELRHEVQHQRSEWSRFYLKKVNQNLFPLQNALLSSLPYLVMFILSLSLSVLSDYLLKRKTLTVGQCRKLFNSLGFYLPMLALVGLGYVSAEQPRLAIVLLILSVGLNGAMYVGFMVRRNNIRFCKDTRNN